VQGSAAARQAALIAGDSYYEHTVERGPTRRQLHGVIEADVVVIGAGAAGLGCALELAERGDRVVVLEAARVGSAASGRNGGQLLPGFSADFEVLERDLGGAAAREAWNMSIEGMEIVEQRARSAPDACEFRHGWMMLAARQRHVAGLRDWHRQLEHDLGYQGATEFVDAKQLRDYCSGVGYHAALIDRRAGHLNPLKLMLSMARQCEQFGVEIFEDTAARSLLAGKPAVVGTEFGEVRCGHVVVAANVFIDALGLPVRRRIMPVGNTIIATEVLAGDVAEGLCRERFAGCDTNFMLDYFRVSEDNRMLFGGASTYLRHDSAGRAVALADKMRARFPELASAKVEYVWGGLIDVTASRAPDFGRLGQFISYLQGFSGHGLNVSAIGARVVAEALHGDSRRLELFERLKHRDFPNSAWLRRSLLSAGTWYYRLRDQLT
jgi:gamma-glutamylputrescine oxidase